MTQSTPSVIDSSRRSEFVPCRWSCGVQVVGGLPPAGGESTTLHDAEARACMDPQGGGAVEKGPGHRSAEATHSHFNPVPWAATWEADTEDAARLFCPPMHQLHSSRMSAQSASATEHTFQIFIKPLEMDLHVRLTRKRDNHQMPSFMPNESACAAVCRWKRDPSVLTEWHFTKTTHSSHLVSTFFQTLPHHVHAHAERLTEGSGVARRERVLSRQRARSLSVLAMFVCHGLQNKHIFVFQATKRCHDKLATKIAKTVCNSLISIRLNERLLQQAGKNSGAELRWFQTSVKVSDTGFVVAYRTIPQRPIEQGGPRYKHPWSRSVLTFTHLGWNSDSMVARSVRGRTAVLRLKVFCPKLFPWTGRSVYVHMYHAWTVVVVGRSLCIPSLSLTCCELHCQQLQCFYREASPRTLLWWIPLLKSLATSLILWHPSPLLTSTHLMPMGRPVLSIACAYGTFLYTPMAPQYFCDCMACLDLRVFDLLWLHGGPCKARLPNPRCLEVSCLFPLLDVA